MLPRFFVPNLDPAADFDLSPDESRHLTRALRLGPGDCIVVFDGRGSEFVARVERASGQGVRARVIERREPAPEPAVQVTLAYGLIKGGTGDDIVRDATMLGVRALQPLQTSRTVVPGAAARSAKTLERWRRIAIASCKQSGRAVVPDIRRPIGVPELVKTDTSDVRFLLVEPSAEVDAVRPSAIGSMAKPASATIAIGPEGGWTADEIALAAAHGYAPLRLGARTIRADAVPVVALTALLLAWGEL